MIAAIGLMIGAYIITRMCSLFFKKEKNEYFIIVKIFAIITIVVTLVCVYEILDASRQDTNNMNLFVP